MFEIVKYKMLKNSWNLCVFVGEAARRQGIPVLFWKCWHKNFKNVNITLDVCKKWYVWLAWKSKSSGIYKLRVTFWNHKKWKFEKYVGFYVFFELDSRRRQRPGMRCTSSPALIKSTRTLIAKAIVREYKSFKKMKCVS